MGFLQFGLLVDNYSQVSIYSQHDLSFLNTTWFLSLTSTALIVAIFSTLPGVTCRATPHQLLQSVRFPFKAISQPGTPFSSQQQLRNESLLVPPALLNMLAFQYVDHLRTCRILNF